MGSSASTLLLIASFSLGQTAGTIDKEDREFQGKVYQQWWGTDFEWKFRELPEKAEVAKKRIPYSGYIYPDQAGGTVSAMRKYDRAFHNGTLRATAYEQRDTSLATVTSRPVTYRAGPFGGRTVTYWETVYAVPHWYGHCNGWTSAAIRHAEPQKSVKRNGVVFSPADIKGLLAEIYMYSDEQMLAGDGTHLNPGLLHAIVTNWLGRGLHPLGMEADPGNEKWNYPIYAYSSNSVERSPNAVDVTLKITNARSSRGEYDQSPRWSQDRYFHYRLNLDDDGAIVGGLYYRDSSQIDMLWVPLQAKQGGQEGNQRGNPHVDVSEVLDIWRQSVSADVRRNWVVINPPNYEPAITSPSTHRTHENQLAVLTVTARDEDLEQPLHYVEPQTLSFSLVGGADQSRFSIDAATGMLAFNDAPDFEDPADADQDNVYEVEVTVDDGADGVDRQLVSVTVSDANDEPIILSADSATPAENQTIVRTISAIDQDLPAQPLHLTLRGGADRAKFKINSATGELSFRAAPDFEKPADANQDNVYEVEVSVDDGQGSNVTQLVRARVVDANDNPRFTSTDAPVLAENRTEVLTVISKDADLPATPPRFALGGGPDRTKFSIDDTTGKLFFNQSPDFETPLDANGDNIYEVEVQVEDGAGGSAAQLISVAVVDANDDPSITSGKLGTIAENQTTVFMVTSTDEDLPAQAPKFSLSGGADQRLFSIDAETGELAFKAAPNFEQPVDHDKDNLYEVKLLVSDGAGGEAAQLVNVSVTDANDIPVVTSSASAQVAENQLAALRIEARDEDLPASALQFFLTGGADQTRFTVDARSGELAFNTPPNFEQPADANRDNAYEVEVKVVDGAGGAAVRLVSVRVTDANDDPVIAYTPKVVENQTAVLTVAGEDEDQGSKFSVSISGGADQTQFLIDAQSGELAFAAAPNFEQPADADKDNVYEVEVSLADGAQGSAAQRLKISVADQNDDPIITTAGSVTMEENQKVAVSVAGTDEDLPAQAIRFALVGGADQTKFSLNPKTGKLAFKQAPDFEKPRDANQDNVYEVEVALKDDARGRAEQLIKVTVADVQEVPETPAKTKPNVDKPKDDKLQGDKPTIDKPTGEQAQVDESKVENPKDESPGTPTPEADTPADVG